MEKKKKGFKGLDLFHYLEIDDANRHPLRRQEPYGLLPNQADFAGALRRGPPAADPGVGDGAAAEGKPPRSPPSAVVGPFVEDSGDLGFRSGSGSDGVVGVGRAVA